MKAPRATEYPKACASSARAKQRPTLATMVVSGRFSRTTRRTARGTRNIPTTTRATRNAARRPTVTARGPGESPVPAAMAVRVASRRMAIRSSTMRIPTTISRSFPETRCSWKALATMVVLEMATTAPVNRLSTAVQPKAWATV